MRSKPRAEKETHRGSGKLVGRRCHTIFGDIGDEPFCRSIVDETIREFGKLDVLVNNAGDQHERESLEEISAEQLERTFRTNEGRQRHRQHYIRDGLPRQRALLDYSSTRGAIVAFTRSLARNLAKKKVRVNGVAPGPIWTPLIASTFPPERVEKFGRDTPLGRPGQPDEVAPCYVFLASDDSSYITGQVLHPNGGEVVNG